MTGGRRSTQITAPEKIGLTRAEAADYISVSLGHFDQMVQRGLMPAPKQMGNRLIWDRRQVDAAFAEYPPVHVRTPDEEEAARWAP